MNIQSTSNFSLIGENVVLRDIHPSDVNGAYCQWMKDPEITRYLESRFQTPSIEDLKQYVKKNIADPDTYLFAIVDKITVRHIGNIKLGPIRRVHRSASIGILLGDKRLFGRGLGTESIGLVADFAFNDLGLHKLTAGCYAPNRAAEKAFAKNGFKREGLRKQHCLFEGEYIDIIELGLINTRGGRDD